MAVKPIAAAVKGAFTASGERAAAATAQRLTSRADDLSGMLDPIAQTRRTSAVLATKEGPDVLASGGRDLSGVQKSSAGSNEIIARNAPGLHAEPTALLHAAQNGLTPDAIAASRNFCSTCVGILEESGVTITGPRTARWIP